jgi:hypothetical protein
MSKDGNVLCRFIVAFSLCNDFFSFVPKRKSTKVKVFIRMECVVGLCTLESRQHFFTSSFANGCQVEYLEYKDIEQGREGVV